jgi:hypothetical protein
MVTHFSKISASLGKRNFTNNFDTQPGEPEMSQKCVFLYYSYFSVFIAAARDSTSDSEKVLRFLRVRHLANAENYASLPIPFLTGILRNQQSPGQQARASCSHHRNLQRQFLMFCCFYSAQHTRFKFVCFHILFTNNKILNYHIGCV